MTRCPCPACGVADSSWESRSPAYLCTECGQEWDATVENIDEPCEDCGQPMRLIAQGLSCSGWPQCDNLRAIVWSTTVGLQPATFRPEEDHQSLEYLERRAYRERADEREARIEEARQARREKEKREVKIWEERRAKREEERRERDKRIEEAPKPIPLPEDDEWLKSRGFRTQLSPKAQAREDIKKFFFILLGAPGLLVWGFIYMAYLKVQFTVLLCLLPVLWVLNYIWEKMITPRNDD